MPNAREVSDVPIIEWGGYSPAERVAARLEAIGVTARPSRASSASTRPSPWACPTRTTRCLREKLPGLELVDVTLPYARLRLIKSEEEVGWLRKAAELTDKAMVALAEGARPGMSDVELVALSEAAYRSEGGMPRIMFLRSMAMDDPNGCLPAQNPSRRRISAGDVIITEFSASYWGYTGQIQRPIFVEAEPTDEWRRMFDVALESYDDDRRDAQARRRPRRRSSARAR